MARALGTTILQHLTTRSIAGSGRSRRFRTARIRAVRCTAHVSSGPNVSDAAHQMNCGNSYEPVIDWSLGGGPRQRLLISAVANKKRARSPIAAIHGVGHEICRSMTALRGSSDINEVFGTLDSGHCACGLPGQSIQTRRVSCRSCLCDITMRGRGLK